MITAMKDSQDIHNDALYSGRNYDDGVDDDAIISDFKR
jgi:hypothetical protein